MNRTQHPSIALALATGLALAGVAMPANAQIQEQLQRSEDRRERQREGSVRAEERVQRDLSDSQRAHALGDRRQWIEQRRRQPVIGVLLAPDPFRGVRIAGVTPKGAAADAGLKSGDRLITIAGSQILGSDGDLRLANARRLLVSMDTKTPVRLGYVRGGKSAVAMVTPKIGERVILLPGADGDSHVQKRIRIREDGNDVFELEIDGMDDMVAPHAASKIHKEIIRLGPGGKCKGANCKTPMLMSAFRWNGLNLASLDPQLGRYFGTDKGVLVLSNGELKGLQGGDVIQTVDGKAVDSPREVMAALRGKPANAGVAVGYLRDRKAGRTTITVPGVMRRLPLPPAPPAPPAPPNAPRAPMPPAPPSGAGLAVPPAPPAPPAPPPAVQTRRIVWVSEDRSAGGPSLDDEDLAPQVIEEVEVEIR